MAEGLKYVLTTTGEAGPYLLLWASAILSSMTDNIPLSAVLAKAIASPDLAAVLEESGGSLWWSIIIGANLGGNISPIGSASTVVAFTIFRKEKIPITFMEFVKIGGIFAVGQLLLGTIYIWMLTVLEVPLV